MRLKQFFLRNVKPDDAVSALYGGYLTVTGILMALLAFAVPTIRHFKFIQLKYLTDHLEDLVWFVSACLSLSATGALICLLYFNGLMVKDDTTTAHIASIPMLVLIIAIIFGTWRWASTVV